MKFRVRTAEPVRAGEALTYVDDGNGRMKLFHGDAPYHERYVRPRGSGVRPEDPIPRWLPFYACSDAPAETTIFATTSRHVREHLPETHMNTHHKAALAQPENAPRLVDTQLRIVLPLPEGATVNDGEAPRLCDGKPAVAITMERKDWKQFAREVNAAFDDVDDLLTPPKPATSAVKSS